jgi:RNA recognition motif-containing protein
MTTPQALKRTVYVGKLSAINYFILNILNLEVKPSLTFLIFLGGLSEEADVEVVKAAFIPFGDINDVQMPLDYETQQHRGFAFVEFEANEDAAAAIDNMVS